MKTVFERHNIFYLSPSTINLWISQPAMCLLKIAGYSDGEAGSAAWRGTAVDKAVTDSAFNQDTPTNELVQKALDVFDTERSNAQSQHDEKKIEKERAAISGYVEQGSKFYRSLGKKPESAQGKVRVQVSDIPVMFYGYYDLLYEDAVRDTKTSARITNSLTNAAARQASIYALGTGREPWIDYVTPKEVNSFRVSKVDYWLRQVELATKGLERVLSFSDDTLECCQLVYPDLDHWMWSDGMKAIAKDIWQMENHDET